MCENPVMALSIKKRTSTELFIDRKVALNIGETRIRVVTYEGDQQVGPALLEEQVYLPQKCLLMITKCGNERSGINPS